MLEKRERCLVNGPPYGSEFQARVKKIPPSVARQSTCLRSGPGRDRSHMGYGATVYGWVWVGQGSGVFSSGMRSSS